MDRKWVKFGVLLLGLWLLVLVGIATSYKAIESSRSQVEELGHSVDNLRNSFFYDAPYRAKMADRQALDLQLIYALRLQIDAYYQKSWLSPDLNQLLFTTDRFIEQAQAYLDNELAVQTLAQLIHETRDRYALSDDLANQYFQLSANVFEAMYLSEQANAEIFRHVDRIYQQSTQLEGDDKQALQKVLVDVSQVLSSYAQGRYLVDKLITHDVSNQITALEFDYRLVLHRHIYLGIVLTLVTMIGYLGLLYLAQSPRLEAESESLLPTTKVTENSSGSDARIAVKETSLPQINFDTMLGSLNGDLESVCMLLEVFVADHANDVAEITRLLSESPEEAQRKAHSLKGVGGNLGAIQLREVATKVELAIQNDITQVSAHLEELKVCLDTAIQEAQTFLKQQNDS
tara:strand:- start:595 stop:1800 length:1206 start_codon:yes stop_codon:yes gene_type:complete